jgi:hypothetical protein
VPGVASSRDGRVVMTFEQFLDRCNKILLRRIGYDIDGCFDFDWHSYFKNGISPSKAVEDALVYWKEVL